MRKATHHTFYKSKTPDEVQHWSFTKEQIGYKLKIIIGPIRARNCRPDCSGSSKNWMRITRKTSELPPRTRRGPSPSSREVMLFVARVVIVVCTVDLISNGQRLCKPLAGSSNLPPAPAKSAITCSFSKVRIWARVLICGLTENATNSAQRPVCCDQQ